MVDPVNKMLAKTCVLCGEEFTGHGHNPYPLREGGKCCDNCQYNKVVVARANLYKGKRKK